MMSAHDEYWPLTEQQRELQQKAREFALLKIRPAARELDETAAFPTDLYPAMAANDLLGITIPEKWGGVGADTQSYALVMEEMSVGYAAVADLCGLVELIATLLLALGTDAQKERYLGPLPESTDQWGSVHRSCQVCFSRIAAWKRIPCWVMKATDSRI